VEIQTCQNYVLNISIIKILVEETNRYAHQIRSSNNLKPNSRLRKWEDVSHEEMSAFLGLWLSMGILRKPTMASYWYESQQTWLYNTPTFTKIIRRDRFQIILQCLHANNNAGALLDISTCSSIKKLGCHTIYVFVKTII
jgi:hypothetical protein